MRREADAGLARLNTYKRLAARIDRQKTDLRNTLAPLKAAGKVIAGYGASVGTTTMIYHFGLGDFFSFLADDDPGKFDTLSPGLHLPTVASKRSTSEKPTTPSSSPGDTSTPSASGTPRFSRAAAT